MSKGDSSSLKSVWPLLMSFDIIINIANNFMLATYCIAARGTSVSVQLLNTLVFIQSCRFSPGMRTV